MAPATDLEVTTGDVSIAPGAGSAQRGKVRRDARFGLVAVLAFPFLANIAAILRIVQYSPQALISGLSYNNLGQPGLMKPGFLLGNPYIDPNVGFNAQALGHAAAMQWVHGHVPWWNFLSGIGMPLAASIQTASFFPPVLLQLLPYGSLWFHIFLEVAIGWATYALLRELRCTPFAAAAGAIAFELNGAITWVTNAPANPIAFLPLCILGIEYVVNAAGAKRRGGWVLLAIGVWLTVVSGFPEVAVINVGLVACWAVVRIVQHRRDAWRIALGGALGVGVGLLLAAPLLNAFVRYLKVANLGGHTQVLSTTSIPRPGLAMLVSPYAFGGIFDNQSLDGTVQQVWGRVGGYTGVVLVVLACGALFGSRERFIRYLLGAWALLFLGYSYGVPVLHQIVANIPGFAHLAVFRYSTASSLFCLAVLSAMFIDDVRTIGGWQRALRMLPGLALVCVVFAVGYFGSPVPRQWTHLHLRYWYWGSLIVLGGTLLALLVVFVLSRKLAPLALGALLVFEASGLFLVPLLTWPREVSYDTAPVTYLAPRLGTQRYFTSGPIAPNYGSFYGIASTDAADLPVPKTWTDYVHSSLNGCEYPWQFGIGGPHGQVCNPVPVEMLAHFTSYEAAGTKYLVVGERTGDLTQYFQPRTHGAATLDGGETIELGWSPPSFLPGGVLTGITLALPYGVPSIFHSAVCSDNTCVAATPIGHTASGEQFSLVTPITLGGTLQFNLFGTASQPVQVMTVPSTNLAPATVVADGVNLPDRGAVAVLSYAPASLPKLVEHSKVASIYLLPHPAALATAPSCAVAIHSMTSFTATCSQPSTLTYRQLFYAGWRATVSGQATTIAAAPNGVFQHIALPAGTSQISFSYAPPEAPLAWIAALIGVVALAVGAVRARVGTSSRRLAKAGAPGVSATAPPPPAPVTPVAPLGLGVPATASAGGTGPTPESTTASNDPLAVGQVVALGATAATVATRSTSEDDAPAQAAEPVAAEPVAAEPVAAEPVAAEPVASGSPDDLVPPSVDSAAKTPGEPVPAGEGSEPSV